MSARKHYIIFPTNYYDELIESGQRAKAAALVEYFRDMKRGRVYKFGDYAKYWFDDYKKKGTAHKWITVFKYEIGLFFAHWQLQNAQHFSNVENDWKPFGNQLETKNTTLIPNNRESKKSMETNRKPLGNISKESNKKYIYSPADMDISKHLFTKLLNISTGIKQPNFDSWSNEVRLMCQRDNRTHEGIHNMINMIFDDGGIYDGTFWRTNIMSIKKLRDQYDKIMLQVNLAYKKVS